MSDIYKHELQSILNAGQHFYSAETKFIHLSYEQRPFIRKDAIPFYHNALYALALLRTKQRPAMEQGIDLIERLLNFQIPSSESEGNFPRYLHEYPKAMRRFEIVDMLLPLYWIYRDFLTVFSQTAKEQLYQAINEGLKCLVKHGSEHDYSYLLHIQIGSLLRAFGILLNNSSYQEIGNIQLENTLKLGSNKSWGSTRHLSKIILYLSLLHEDAVFSLTHSFWSYLYHSWHQTIGAYVGPGLNEHYYQHRPEPTIYHYFMSKVVSKPLPTLLDADLMEAILLPTFDISHILQPRVSNYELSPFTVGGAQFDNYAYSYFNLDKDQWEKRGGFYPLKIVTKTAEGAVDSLVLQMGTTHVQVQQLNEQKILLVFENGLDHEFDISFFGKVSPRVNQEQASMFDLSRPIEFEHPYLKIQMSFPSYSKEEGVWAHLMRENRRSQIISDFNNTYDWHLYFRKAKENAKSFSIQLELMSIN